MIDLIKKYKIHFLFTLTGGIGGYIYWFYIGCNSGLCPVKSKWYLSVIFGGILGYLIWDIIFDQIKKRKNNS